MGVVRLLSGFRMKAHSMCECEFKLFALVLYV